MASIPSSRTSLSRHPTVAHIGRLLSRLHEHKICASARCARRRHFTSMARLQETNWHYCNQGRSLPVLRFDGGSCFAGRPRLLGQSSQFHPIFLQCKYSTAPRDAGYPVLYSSYVTLNLPRILSTNITWKDRYRHSYRHCRYLATDKDSDDSTSTSEMIDETKSLNGSQTKADQTNISDIKLQVETVSQPKDQTSQQIHGSIRKTQDDFADYLNGEEVTLDEDTGLVVKKHFKSGPNNSKQSTSADSLNIEALDPLSSLPANSVQDSTTTDSTNTNNNTTETPNPDLSHYQYIFTPSDATLSGRERYERRRRAMEQKLEERQAQSRAATYSNVQRALGGNAVIAIAKLAAAISSGSSAMMSEFVHSVVDCGNQALLLVGLKSSVSAPDRKHPYGYGKAIYFWALVSALGTFFLGAGVSMTHSVGELMNPTMTAEVPWEVWGVLGMSFTVDGYVFWKTIQGVMASKRIDGECKEMSFWTYATTKVRDPATLAVLLEDGAACMGVVIAIGGIGMTQYTGLPVCDAVAGMGISALLGAMGLALVQVNHRFLIGQGLDRATRLDIERIILSRRSIDNIYSVQSQWTGPDTFSYKAEVDFDGTFLAAKLMPRYQQEFFDAKDTLDRDLRVLLAWYAEDVMRAAEREIRHIEEEIRTKYPQAQYIELEPMSKDSDRYAIDDGMEAQLRRVEVEVLNRFLSSLYKKKESEEDKDKTES